MNLCMENENGYDFIRIIRIYLCMGNENEYNFYNDLLIDEIIIIKNIILLRDIYWLCRNVIKKL